MRVLLRVGCFALASFLATGCGGGEVAGPPATEGWGDDDDRDDEPWLDAGEPEDDAWIEPPEDAGGVGDDAAVDDGGVIEEDAGTPGDAGAPCVKKTYRLRHLQASMEHFDPPAERASSIDTAFAANAHTISWTEIETADQVQRIQARSGWKTFWPSGKAEVVAKNAVPVSWRADTFTLVKGQSWLASEGLAKVSPSRWVTRVWLRHVASGKIVSRVAHHSVSGVDGAGKDPVEWRRDAHAKNIAKFREVMLLDTVPVIGSADFNTTRLRTLLGTTFRYDVPASGGSHGSRLIDWIVRRPHEDHAFVDVQLVSLGPSDHRGMRAAYDYSPPCK